MDLFKSIRKLRVVALFLFALPAVAIFGSLISSLSFIPGFIWFLLKIWSVFLFTQWMRAAIPRVRIDQMIEIGWKGLLALSFINLIFTAVLVGVIA